MLRGAGVLSMRREIGSSAPKFVRRGARDVGWEEKNQKIFKKFLRADGRVTDGCTTLHRRTERNVGTGPAKDVASNAARDPNVPIAGSFAAPRS